MLVSFENVTFGYTGAPVVRGVTFAVHENERVGFIGGNGEGKTTLLKLMLGALSPDEGEIFRKNGARIGYLEQSGGFERDDTVYRAMEEVFDEDKALLDALRKTQSAMATADESEMRVLAARTESLNKRIAARDSYNFEVRIKTVLNGMNFGSVYDQRIDTMSGGEKTRLKLCRLLLEEPDLLVLDEPTNHLDMKTLFWLEDYLTTYRGALLVVSHDRFFLDRLTARTLELERGQVLSFAGNYSKYKILKQERNLRLEKEYEKQREEIARLQEYVDKNIVRATTAKSAQSRVKQLEKMELLEKPVPPPQPPRFTFRYDDRPYERVLHAEKFDLKADDKLLLKDAEFTLMRGEKCAVLGDNGTGKSTLLKYFLSKPPAVQFGRFVKTAYYDQENADLDPEERVLEAFWGKHALLSQTDARKLLAQAGLDEEDVNKKVKELSGGLKAKLELSLLEARRGNLLVLDEPTNHLDLSAREALEAALKAFDGTVLFVSHDRRFVESVATRIIVLENGALVPFAGTYSEYLESRKTQPAEKKEKPKPDTGYRSKEDRAKEARKKARVREIEARIGELETEEEALNLNLAERAADYKAVQEITLKLNALQAEVSALYEEYEMLI
jgi:ATP-binding cassette subfamily F protein 3